MVVAWKSLRKAIHKRRTSRDRAPFDARPDDASASVVEKIVETKQTEPSTTTEPKKSEYTESATTAKTERSEKHGLLLISDGLSKNSASSREFFGVDIIAIHGLNGDPYKTWTDPETQCLWLRDLLPDDIPGARIFTYGYPSHVLCSTSTAGVSDFAGILLAHIESHRVASERRPIIFVTHSLGGIVCKRALVMASENPRYDAIKANTVGILFFGTPHRGAIVSPEIGIFLGHIVDLFMLPLGTRLFHGRTRIDLIEKLKHNSKDLGDTAEAFGHLLSARLNIITIYESEETTPLGRPVVDKNSAMMAIEKEELIGRFVDHQQLCRFKGRSDLDYNVILGSIRKICEKACYDPSLTESEKDIVRLFKDADVDDYKNNLPTPVDGTCQWLLLDSQYQMWDASEESALLWITGYPGSGKTILSAFVTNHLEGKRPSSKHEAMVCSFFCVEEIENQNDANAILRSIIAQILGRRRHFMKHVKTELGHSNDGRDLLRSYNKLWKVFTDLACDATLGPVNIILDGLDECEEKSRKRLINSIVDLISKLNSFNNRCVKFLITSRPWVALKADFRDAPSRQLRLEDRQNDIDADLRLVIGKRIENLAGRTRATPDTITLLEQSVYGKADRTWLWAKFALQILDDELLLAPNDFPRILSELPRDLEATYARFLRNLQPGHVRLAVELVHIIVGTFRPLSVDEVSWILAIERMTQKDNLDLAAVEQYRPVANVEDAINTALSAFVRISSGKVYLVHHTVKEFLCSAILKLDDQSLIERYHVQPERANSMLASACTLYLTLDEFSHDLFSTEKVSTTDSSSISSSGQRIEDPGDNASGALIDPYGLDGADLFEEPEVTVAKNCSEVARKYALFDYAARYWARHYAKSGLMLSERTRKLAVLLSSNQNQYLFANWFRYYWTKSGIDLPYPSGFSPLVIACYFGHFGPHKPLISHAELEDKDSLGTALYWAARNGEDVLVKDLLKTDVQPDAKTIDYQNALSIATQLGHVDVVKHFTGDDRVDVNVKGKNMRTPLSMAAGNGHVEIVKLLLAYDHLEADLADVSSRTPLFWAINCRNRDVVRLLTSDSRVDINHADRHGQIAFYWAAQEGDPDIVGDLLKLPNRDVECADNSGRTPLSRAAELGHTGVIRQLAKSKKLNLSRSRKDNAGRNPYSWAAWRGHDQVIKMLIKYKVPGVDEEDDSNWTPLFWALESPTAKALATLIDSGLVDVNHRDHSGRTALYWAAGYYNVDKVRLLLAVKGVDAQAQDLDGSTPLAHARKLGQHGTARLLEDFLGPSSLPPDAREANP